MRPAATGVCLQYARPGFGKAGSSLLLGRLGLSDPRFRLFNGGRLFLCLLFGLLDL